MRWACTCTPVVCKMSGMMDNALCCRHQQQNAGFKPGDFVFGPVVMRYYYHVKKPKEAFRSIMDPKLAGIFDQHMTFQLAMDLLLKNEMYNEVIELFKLVQQRAINGDRFPKNCCILVMAALHQMVIDNPYFAGFESCTFSLGLKSYHYRICQRATP